MSDNVNAVAINSSTDWLMIILIAINAVLLCFLVIIWRKRKKREHIYEISTRDQLLAELDMKLANPDYLARSGLITSRRFPYETRYLSNTQNMQESDSPHVGLQVETKMMRQRYFTDTYKPVEVGHDRNCAIVVPDNKMAGRQFVLYSEQGNLFVRNMSTDHTMILERGEDSIRLDDSPIVIYKGDRLLAGSTSFLITMDR